MGSCILFRWRQLNHVVMMALARLKTISCHRAAPALLMTWSSLAGAQAVPASNDGLDAEIRAAFLYSYPYHEFMRLRYIAMHDSTAPTYTTLNAFRHARQLATPDDHWANGPITDTLYSTAWLDVRRSPVVLSLPDTADRYYVIALIGADLNTFEYLGRRKTGTKARTVAVVAPDWHAQIPPADQVIRANSPDVYLNMRVLVDGPDDLAHAHAVQDGFHIRPVNSAVAVGETKMVPTDGDAASFVDVVNEALQRDPPSSGDARLIERFKAVGVCGADCSWEKLTPQVQARWRELMPGLVAQLKSALNADKHTIPRRNGWMSFRLPHSFGDDYRIRASSAAMSGGVLGVEAAEATYFAANVDGAGKALGNGQHYRLRLPQGGLPAKAFWSISLYEFVPGGQYLVRNPINRYSIGDRTGDLRHNSDGSLDIWIQPNDPGPEKRANWLPSPENNNFYLMARVYQPKPEVLDPGWIPEPVEETGP
ncbi:Uncharacterized conserved protein [Collimonas sp. OK607]|uniref:DUF1254 domain-containing protein n=1 Tax=Collimonas sp. OK607 TaxID=1798194 RepID=UPI0008E1EF45|nr:DUF1254 domain-containing protein [Collimonas sp. OK607]SFA82555.1 Uncharacterized conserved protein [Collimonas sp. OK607]